MKPQVPGTQLNERKLRRIIQRELSRSTFFNESKLYRSVEKRSAFTRSSVFVMLESGFFTLEEEAALKVFFRKNRFSHLNESTIKRLDVTISTLNESTQDIVFAEAFGDALSKIKDKVTGAASSVKEKASGLLARAKEALAGGWDKLKKIWKNFTGLVKEICAKVVQGLKKLWESTKSKALDYANNRAAKIKEKADAMAQKEKHVLTKETEHASSMLDYLQTRVYSDWIKGGEWAASVIAGAISPTAMGADEVKESAQNSHLDLADPYTLDEIHSGYGRKVLRENEGEHEEHGVLELETVLKNKTGKKIVEFALKMLQSVFTPLAYIVKEIMGAGSNAILNVTSSVTAKLGGPSAIKYVALGILVGELLATLCETLVSSHLGPEMMQHAFHATIAAFVPYLHAVVKAVQGILLVYAVVVCVSNIADTLSGGKITRVVAGEAGH